MRIRTITTVRQPADLNCSDAADNTERRNRNCGLGIELTLLLVPLLRLGRRRGDLTA